MKKVLLICLLFLLSLASCKSNDTDQNNGGNDDAEVNPIKSGYYYVYDANDKLLMETNSLYSGIIKARDNSKTSSKCYVLDSNKQEVYKYLPNYYFMYQGETYVGRTDNKERAITWGRTKSNAYVMNGKGTEFVYVSYEVVSDNPLNLSNKNLRGIENMSGSYHYVFSKKATSELLQGNGYSYVEFILEFSKARIKYFTDKSNESSWNAYVFAVITCDNPWMCCDLGIINGGWDGGEGRWQPVFNLNGNMYMPDKGPVITTFNYDEQTSTYYGCDDLYFKCYVEGNYYVLNITNLTTNVEYLFKAYNENLSKALNKQYVILAASNCPVSKSGSFWNPRCGNSFENVIFRDVKVKQYNEDYNNSIPYDLYPSSISCDYQFTMVPENADMHEGIDELGRYIVMNMYNDFRERK